MNIQNLASLMIVLCASVVILILGEPIIVPFIFALLIWLMVRKIKFHLNRIPFVKRWFPGWVKNIVMSALIFLAFAFMAQLIIRNIEMLAGSYRIYETNLVRVTDDMNRQFGIDILKNAEDYSGKIDFGKLFASVFVSLQGILSNALIILLYVAFIFIEESHFPNKLRGIFTKPAQYDKVTDILNKIEVSVASYIGLKTLVNLISAVASFIVLFFAGVEAPLFWAFLIFILNFIPVIGMFVSTAFPAAFALAQFGSMTPCLIVLAAIGGVQFIVSNIVETKIIGNSLNLSPLIAIIALAFWGALWGITGMFLSVPITVIMIIVCSQFRKTRAIALLFSEKGKI